MFYARYVDLCSERKVSPSKVALDCDFNKGSVSVWKKKYLQGEDVSPSSDILLKLADYFNVSLDYLMGKSQNKKSPTTDSDEALKFALWGGDSEIIDEDMIEDVKDFARLLAEKKKRKMEQNK